MTGVQDNVFVTSNQKHVGFEDSMIAVSKAKSEDLCPGVGQAYGKGTSHLDMNSKEC